MLAPLLAYVGVLAVGYGIWNLSASVTIVDSVKFYIGAGLLVVGVPIVLYVVMFMISLYQYLHEPNDINSRRYL